MSLKFNLFSINVQQQKKNFYKQTVNGDDFGAPRISLGTLLGGENEILGPVPTEVRAVFLTFAMKVCSTFTDQFTSL